MKGREQLFSTGNGEHRTPRDLFRWADWKFGKHTIDAAATAENALCKRFITQEDDAFETEWGPGNVWCNPPYGREVGFWIDRGFAHFYDGAVVGVTFLLPARTDTEWFHRAVERFPKGLTIYLLRGRLRFEGQDSGAPFPSMILRWDVRNWQARAHIVAADWKAESAKVLTPKGKR